MVHLNVLLTHLGKLSACLVVYKMRIHALLKGPLPLKNQTGQLLNVEENFIWKIKCCTTIGQY